MARAATDVQKNEKTVNHRSSYNVRAAIGTVCTQTVATTQFMSDSANGRDLTILKKTLEFTHAIAANDAKSPSPRRGTIVSINHGRAEQMTGMR
jgi:hypothetical protein